jgi:Cd2+/Zn2+-exporting ATPase
VRAALRKLKVGVGKRVAADDHAGHDHGPGATTRAKRSTAPAMATTIATPNFSAPIPS